MKSPKINQSFQCTKCGKQVAPHPTGSCRDHCPFCLWGQHLDQDIPGDRQSKCQGLMEPITAEKDPKHNMVIIYRCQDCRKDFRVQMAPDDNWDLIVELSTH